MKYEIEGNKCVPIKKCRESKPRNESPLARPHSTLEVYDHYPAITYCMRNEKTHTNAKNTHLLATERKNLQSKNW